MKKYNHVPEWFYQIMYEQCDGFVECSPDLGKIWAECQKHFVVTLNTSTVISRRYAVKQIEVAGGSVKGA